MRPLTVKLAAVLALFATGTAQAATTQTCITRPEIEGMIGYVAPTALNKVATLCRPTLPATSFTVTRLPALISQLEANRTSAWPMARSAFLKFGGPGADAKLLGGLSDSTLRPLLDEMLGAELTKAITPASCGDIDDVLTTMGPLPPQNLISLLAVIASVAGRKDGRLSSCPRGR